MIVPLFVGFAVRHFFAKRVEKISAIFPAISVTFIVLVCARTIAANRDSLLGMTGMLVAIGLLMNVLGLVGGYGIAWISRMDVPQRRSLAIEGGMQNAGLGAVLASEHFSDKAAMPAAIFVFVCIITASLLAAYWQRAGRRSAVPRPWGKSEILANTSCIRPIEVLYFLVLSISGESPGRALVGGPSIADRSLVRSYRAWVVV